MTANNSIYRKYLQYIGKEISFDEAKDGIAQLFLEYFFQNEFKRIIAYKAHEDIDMLIELVGWFGMEELYLDDFHQLLLEGWHTRHERLIEIFQHFKSPATIPFIAKILESETLDYLLKWETDYASLVRKCMWTLADINTDESKSLLSRYLLSENKVIKQFAEEQLRWLQGEKGMRYMG
jgi:hypothetical protein